MIGRKEKQPSDMGREPHRFHTPYKIKADENYGYVAQTGAKRNLSKILCAFVCTVMPLFLRIFQGLHIRGRENLRKLQGGAVSVCNHVHPMDCVALACAFWRLDTYFLSQRENFCIPVIRHIIKILKALPIPENRAGYTEMFRQLEPEISGGALLHIYPEGSLRTDCMLLREFKPGAFRIADMYGIPILPCAIKIVRGKLRIKRILTIGEPVYSDISLPEHLRVEKLERDVRTAMEMLL